MYQAGLSYSELHHYAAAREQFTAYIKTVDDNTEKADGWMNMAVTYRREQKWCDAKEALCRVAEYAPAHAELASQQQKLEKAIYKTVEKQLASTGPKIIILASPQTFFATCTARDIEQTNDDPSRPSRQKIIILPSPQTFFPTPTAPEIEQANDHPSQPSCQ